MSRKIFTIPDDLEAALNAESKKVGSPEANIIRAALTEYLKGKGYKLGDSIQWGGKRADESE